MYLGELFPFLMWIPMYPIFYEYLTVSSETKYCNCSCSENDRDAERDDKLLIPT